MEKEKIELVQQKLPNYFDSLQEHDIKDFLIDYHDFNHYGYKQFSDKQVD